LFIQESGVTEKIIFGHRAYIYIKICVGYGRYHYCSSNCFEEDTFRRIMCCL